MSAAPQLVQEALLSERIRQLQRRIERAKPVYKQYMSGELRVMSEAQRRQVSTFPLWLEDLEALKQGHLPPVRRCKEPSWEEEHVIRDVDSRDDTGLKVATHVAMDGGVEDEQQPHQSGAAPHAAEDDGGNGKSIDASDDHERDARGKSETLQRKRSKMGRSKTKSAAGDGLVGDLETDEREVLRRLRSLLPRAREDFLRRYVEKVTDTEELRVAKKKYETSSNLRQKILSGAISRPSNAQLEKVAELSELRRTVNLLKQHERKEHQRLTRYFMQRLEEEDQKAACVPFIVEEEKLNGGAEMEPAITTAHASFTNDSAQIISGKGEGKGVVTEEISASPEASPFLVSSEELAVVEEDAIPPSLDCVDLSDVKSDTHGVIVQSGENEEGVVTDLALLSESGTCGSTTVAVEANSFVVSGGLGISSSNTSCNTSAGCSRNSNVVADKVRASKGAIDWKSLEYFQTKSRLEIKVMIPRHLQQQITTSTPISGRKKKSGGSHHSGNESISTGSLSIGHGGESSGVEGCSKHVVRDEIGYVQLNISRCFGGRRCELHQQNVFTHGMGAQAAMVLQRVDLELQYVMRHPISRVDVVCSRVLCDGRNSVHSLRRRDEVSNGAGVVEWIVHVTPWDGPLSGQLVPVVIIFSLQYPFAPPLIYSSVFLPLLSVMVSESGQRNTLRLASMYDVSAEDDKKRLLGARCSAWRPECSVYKLLLQLQDFFGADAFALSREALGPELYSRSVRKARLACGRMTAEFLADPSTTMFLSCTPLSMVNGPFLLLSEAGGSSLSEGARNKEPPRCMGVEYHVNSFHGMIRGPFKGCWGHLLMVPVTAGSSEELKETSVSQKKFSAPVLNIHLTAPPECLLPKLELVALSQQSLAKKESHWAVEVLGGLSGDDEEVGNLSNNSSRRKGRKESGRSIVISRLSVELSGAREMEGNKEVKESNSLVQVFFDVDGESRSPRCVESRRPCVSHLYLPGRNSFPSVRGDEVPVAWAILLRVREGDAANVVFSAPIGSTAAEGNQEETAFGQSNTQGLISVVDVVADALSRSTKGSSTCSADSYRTSSLFCVATLDNEVETPATPSPQSLLLPKWPLGIVCEVLLPPSSANNFVLRDVIVHPSLVLSEAAFDTHFGVPSCDTRKFFIATTPIASCTFFLPLVEQNRALPEVTLNRLKRSVTQLFRNPAASTTYNPPFKVAQALRFFSLVLGSLGRQWTAVQGVDSEEVCTQRRRLRRLYFSVLLTFAQLFQGVTVPVELSCSIFIGGRVREYEGKKEAHKAIKKAVQLRGDGHGDENDCNDDPHEHLDETTVVERLLTLWCTLTMSRTTSDASGDTATVSQLNREDWVSATAELFSHMNKSSKKRLIAEAQSHATLMGAAASTNWEGC